MGQVPNYTPSNFGLYDFFSVVPFRDAELTVTDTDVTYDRSYAGLYVHHDNAEAISVTVPAGVFELRDSFLIEQTNTGTVTFVPRYGCRVAVHC